jgi:hypothetical protein
MGANVSARESAISLPRVLSAAQEFLANVNIETYRYYLATVEKKSRVTASARSGKNRAEEYYELWWVSAERQRSRYLRLRVPANGRIQQLPSSASSPRIRDIVSAPKIPLEEALRLSKAYVLEHSLASSAHYLQSASLFSAGRSARDTYWCVRLRDRRGTEGNDILLVVRMEGTVGQLHLT